ncbi:MAG: exodeoxyribonuclease V subunit alpha [Actinomycetota bacterium]|nr:exodeoxyribonuclease V subunit alpha [Actinomycetota bacterium]
MTAHLARRRPLASLLQRWVSAGVLTESDAMVAASCAELAGESDERVLLAMALAVRAPRSGHVALDLAAVRDQVLAEMEHLDPAAVSATQSLDWPDDPDAWLASVMESQLVAASGAPLVVDLGLIYLRRFHRHEVSVADRIRALATMAASGAGRLDDVARVLELDDGQRDAVARCVSGRLGVLTGGPGTGKTRTVAALLAALIAGSDGDVRIALAAPTGKAAARMAESIDASVSLLTGSGDDEFERIGEMIAELRPSTIHRLLGVRGGGVGFRHDTDRPLAHDVVVIDEASMVSLPLMDAVLHALGPQARLILVGDAGQLASVDAGSVLGDVAGAGGAIQERVAELQESRRFPSESRIGRFAEAIRAGNGSHARQILDEPVGDGEPEGVVLRRVDTPSRVTGEIDAQVAVIVEAARHGDAATAVHSLDALRVLCAHRSGRAGVSFWNRAIESRIAALGRVSSGMYPGRPLMITRNDPARRLFNGDVGVVIRTDDGPRVAFGGEAEPRLIAPSHLEGTETVHAMTIHKSQGSEFDHVVVVLPSADSRLATRELLYTAVTRARRQVTLIGDGAVVEAAIGRTSARTSGLRQRLG